MIIVLVAAIIVTALISVFAAQNYYNNRLYISSKDSSFFYGTYQLNNGGEGADGLEFLSLIAPTSDGKNGEFVRYSPDSTVIQEGECKLNDRGYITLYSDNEPIATMIYSCEKYCFIQNGEEAVIVDKTSDTPIVP